MSELKELMDVLKVMTDRYSSELEPDGDLRPILFILKDGEISMGTFDMPESPYRDFLFGTLLPNNIKGLTPDPDAVVLLVSTWFLMLEDIKNMDEYEGPMPSQAPDRREAILITGVSKDEEIYHFGEIIRREGEHPLIEWKDTDDGNFEGRILSGLRRSVWS